MTVPPGAIAAAAEALTRMNHGWIPANDADKIRYRATAKRLLEAAAPLIRDEGAAAERDRLKPLLAAGDAMASYIETQWSPVLVAARPSAKWRQVVTDLVADLLQGDQP